MTSLGPVFHPESLFDGPGARKWPPEAENVENRPLHMFRRRLDLKGRGKEAEREENEERGDFDDGRGRCTEGALGSPRG